MKKVIIGFILAGALVAAATVFTPTTDSNCPACSTPPCCQNK